MIILEALGELVEVLGGSRSGQEGPMSTKCCADVFEHPTRRLPPQRLLRPGSDGLRGMPPEALRARL